MNENNEVTKIMDWVVGLLLFCIVIACLIILIVFGQQHEEHFVQTMHDATNSSRLQRLTELDMSDDPVLCTAVANILSEFGPEELAYVEIVSNGVCDVYHSSNIPVEAPSGYQSHSSSAPIEESVKKLLKYSEKTCDVKVVTEDTTGFSYVMITVN